MASRREVALITPQYYMKAAGYSTNDLPPASNNNGAPMAYILFEELEKTFCYAHEPTMYTFCRTPNLEFGHVDVPHSVAPLLCSLKIL